MSMYGTTSCEAVHGELVRLTDRAIVQKTRHYAVTMADLFSAKKVFIGMLQRGSSGSEAWCNSETIRMLSEVVVGGSGVGSMEFQLSAFESPPQDRPLALPSNAMRDTVQKGQKRRAR